MTNVNDGAALSEQKEELLALLLEEEGLDIPGSAAIKARGETETLPLSFAQQRLWFLDQLQPGSPAYHISIAIRLTGRLNAAALEQTLCEIVRRHEALRTSFRDVEGRPVQVITRDLSLRVRAAALGEVSGERREAEAVRLAGEQGREAFDLERGPLLRVSLLRMSEDDHVLVMTMHHIVTDGWSMGVLVREVGTLYRCYSTGIASPLKELEIQYADFAIWQREWLEGKPLDDQLAYWKKRLGGALPMLQLPTDRPRPAVQRFEGGTQTLTLPPELTERVRGLSLSEGATLFTTLLAAFKAMLHRYTGQQDILVGTPVANRNRVEIEDLIGFFANTQVLRTDMSGDPTFQELLRRVREVSIDAYNHQDLPFEKLVEELQPDRDLSHTPVFQVAFVLQNTPQRGVELGDLKMSPVGLRGETAKFDLTLSVAERKRVLAATMEYNSDLFEAGTIGRMLKHYETILEGIVADPGQRLSQLPLLTPTERRQLLVDWSESGPDYVSDLSLNHLFEAQVEERPEAIAVICEDGQLSYQELNARANQLGRYLRAQGVRTEVLVGICMERSLELVVGLLGILKAGGAYMPLDPAYPKDRLAFMLEDAQAAVLLTQERLVDTLPQHLASVACLDRDWETVAQYSNRNPSSDVAPENLAYVIYTSGSTGAPKGVMVSHHNVARLFEATESWFNFKPSDVWTLFHSHAFDFSVWELWGALLHGGRLAVIPYWVSRSPEAVREVLWRERVTVLNQTPSAFRQLIRADDALGNAQELNLRLVIFGGEVLDLESLRPWFDRHDELVPRLVNMYGITETTVHVTCGAISPADRARPSASPIGGPIADLRVYTLDQRLEPVPIGVGGEMYVGGGGLARGYLNRPELTAERFIPDPFSGKPGGRLYQSGDLARYVCARDIEYLGRIDHQVKIRGFRIELGEIEQVLGTHHAVNETAVVARQQDGGGEKYLAAYVVAKPERSPSVDELRGFLKQKLPEYMVPAAFVMIESLPLTANGKVDRRALPAPGLVRPDLGEAYVAPRTGVEEVLAAIWAEVLGFERVGIKDNFFALGGDSIRSIRVISLARQSGLKISLQQLFRLQTICALAGEIGPTDATLASMPRTTPFSLISEEDYLKLPSDVEDAYPLAMLQAGMLFHMQATPDSPVYHNVDSWHLEARFDQGAFEQAVQTVVSRHPALRTSFELSGYSEPLQLVHKTASLPVQVQDLRHLSPGEQQEALAAFFENEKTRRFDLSEPPLLRFHIHRRTGNSFQFTLTECHAILDGWSLHKTLAEVFDLHFALLNHQTPPDEAPPAVTFRDFIALERSALQSEECRAFWDRKLSGATPIRLPRSPSSVDAAVGKGWQRLALQLPDDVVEGLKRLARSAAVPFKSTLIAAHLRLLSLISGQVDVMTGLSTHGRPEEINGEQVRGLFLNTAPFRVQLSGGAWTDLVRQTFQAELEFLPFRYYPMAALQKNPGEPLFETAVAYLHFHAVEELLRSGNIKAIGGRDSNPSNIPLQVGYFLVPASSRLSLILDYDAKQFCAEQIKVIQSHYVRILTAMADDPSADYDALSLLSAEEENRILKEWNDTGSEYPKDEAIQVAIEREAGLTPDAIAVAFEGQWLSYRELNSRANQLAHVLVGRGVGAEQCVGICMDRGLELVIGLLAILKAGGAYVPLDGGYPKERLDFMLDETGACLVLTEEKLKGVLGDRESALLCVDSQWEEIGKQSRENLGVEVEGGNVAYVIYTSGSSGRPKGVEITHGGLTNLVWWHREAYEVRREDRATQLAAISFDASGWEIWPYLTAGAGLYVVDEETRWSAEEVREHVVRNEITISYLPTPLAEEALGLEWGEETSLRVLLTGGDRLRIYPREGLPFRVANNYGPTENTVVATSGVIGGGGGKWRQPTIGRPIANTEVYLVDRWGQPAPVSVAGELCIGGDSLGRGYVKRADLSAEKFVPNPFSARAGGRLYRTGDLARYLPDGEIEFLERIDEQVKIRGFRIELGEVEAVLARHPGVSRAVVVAREYDAGDKRLVAYVVIRKGYKGGMSELRQFLKERLPDYMLPWAFVILDELPLTANGKVDRRALPEPDVLHMGSDVPQVAPRDVVEQTIAGIWQEALHVSSVGVHDNFFDLGGNSILTMRVHGKLREVFKRDIPILDMFKHPTVGHMATYLTKAQSYQPPPVRTGQRAETGRMQRQIERGQKRRAVKKERKDW